MTDDRAHHSTEADSERELEALLRHARPVPDLAWRDATERELLPRRAERAVPRWRFAFGVATGLAVAIFGVTLAGGGPLASNGGDAARAKPGCTTVYVTRVEPTGELRRGADGTVRVETVQRPITRAEQRCR